MHGSTLHGMQSLDPKKSDQPWTYYHRTGPIGDIFQELAKNRPIFKQAGRIGVVGLGTGTLAAYGLPGQHLTFFEIDAAVERIARDPRYFTYLENCRADLKVRLGDARLSLAEEADGQFDVLLVDAFSSDAVPVHLLTREALELYFKKLAPRGLLAVHITNRHLDLEPVLGNLAAALGVAARVRNDDRKEDATGRFPSTWVVLARWTADLGDLAQDSRWDAVETNSEAPWTDDFSNLYSVIEWDLEWDWLPGWKWWHGGQQEGAAEGR